MYLVNDYFFPHGSPGRPLFLEYMAKLGLHRVTGGRGLTKLHSRAFEILYPMEQYRVSIHGVRVYDWIEHTSSRGDGGYYLLLPDGVVPLPPYTAPARELSRTARAIAWVLEQPGRKQTDAAEMFGISQAAISAALCKRIRQGLRA